MMNHWGAILLAQALLCDGASLRNEVDVASQQRTSQVALRGFREHEVVDPDSDALNQFVRQCAVSMSIRDAKHLPTDALDAFCGATTEQVQCRLQLSSKLIKVHQEGSSVIGFCKDVYAWNAKSFGMLCPLQCEKLQCVSTCQWLKEKKKMNSERSDIDIKYDQALKDKQALTKLRDQITQQKQESLERSRDVAQARTNLNRSQTSLMDSQGELGTAEKNLQETQEKVAALETDLETTQQNLTKQEKSLEEFNFKTDKREMNQKKLLSEMDQTEGWIHKRVKSLKEAKVTFDEAYTVLKTNSKVLAKLRKASKMVAGLAEKQATKVVLARGALKKAEMAFKNARDQEAPEEAMKALAVFVKRQQRVAKEEEDKFHDLAQDHRKLSNQIDLNDKELEKLTQEAATLRSKSKKKATEVDALNKNYKEQKSHAEQHYDSRLKGRGAEKERRESEIAETKKYMAKVKRAQEFSMNLEKSDLMPALKNKEAPVADAKKSVESAQAKMESAEQKLRDSNAALAKLEEQEETENTDWTTANGAVMDEMKALRNQTDGHLLERPEIVRQHGLGLWNFVGMTEMEV